MKLRDLLNESTLKLFHGTDFKKVESIRKRGFRFGQSGISDNNDKIVFLSTKQGALWFAKNNTRNEQPAIIEVNVSGNWFNTNKITSDYGAYAIVCDFFNIPFKGNPKNREVDIELVRTKLIDNGYVGVTFKDKYANNIPVWAVFDISKINVL